MPNLKSRCCGPNCAPGWPPRSTANVLQHGGQAYPGLPPLRLSQVRLVLAACAISLSLVAEVIECRSSSSYERAVPANLAPGVISALASKEGSQIRAVSLPLEQEPVAFL